MPLALPAHPRLTFRVAFAGSRDLAGPDAAFLDDAVERLLLTIARELSSIAERRHEPGDVARYYADDKLPLLRVVTGLAEGSDAVVSTAVLRLGKAGSARGVELELAAVIPAELTAYRGSRPPSHHDAFDAVASRCSCIIALDGILDRPEPDTPLAARRRSRAYRAQGGVLLRQADLLIAATTGTQPGRAGGTLETVRAALERDMSVLFVDLARRTTWLIEPFQDLAAVLSTDAPSTDEVQAALRQRVSGLLVDVGAVNSGTGAHGGALLEEYFHAAHVPPQASDGTRRRTRRERLWSWFERRFQPAHETLPADVPLAAIASWRTRATQLNYHYAGLYRGAYLLNYALAILAVTLAALSLVLLGQSHPDASLTAPVAPGSSLQVVLLALALLKAGAVGAIAWNTHEAQHGDWNEKLVDYRYLAERLRAMFHLPLLGSIEAPSTAPPQYASRVVRQSAVDWLFEALLRAVDPRSLTTEVAYRGGNGNEYTVHLLRPDAGRALQQLRGAWIPQQAAYHARLARTMDRLHHFLDRWGRRLNIAVIAVVAVDILLTIGELLHLFPAPLAARIAGNMPWLVFLAAVLPAAVAGLNAVRFQSECRRLADRSAVVRTILAGRERGVSGGRLLAADLLARQMAQAHANAANNPGSWVMEVLRQAEVVARDLAEEAGEWSVLYAKELPEP